MIRRSAWIWLAAGCADEPRGPCTLDARPETVGDVVATINELPSPVTLACLLTSLERPLGVELSSNVFSAQPAQGTRNPRIFVRTDALTLSVVPVGVGSSLLEIGEHAGDELLTVKAEIEFPVQTPLDEADAYERIPTGTSAFPTSCGVCHPEEREVGPGRWTSAALKPRAEEVVPLDALRSAHRDCDPAAEPERCAMFSGLLDHGEVYRSPFPDDYLTL